MKNSVRIYLSLFSLSFLIFSSSLKALDLITYCEANQASSEEEFLNTFPYQEYLRKLGFYDVQTFEKHRVLLNKQSRNGDKFLFKLTQAFLNQEKYSLKQAQTQIQLVEALKAQSEELGEEIYALLADMILEKLANETEKALKEGQYSKHDPELQKLLKQLNSHQFIIDVPQSKWEKLQYHIQEGHWTYILDRVTKETGLSPISLSSLLILILFSFLFYAHQYRQYKRSQSKIG